MWDGFDALENAIDRVVAPSAEQVDFTGAFPTESIAALADAGVLGVPMPSDDGGGGGDLGDAAKVVRVLAEVCGSTAMIVMMHYAAASVINAYGPESTRRAIGSGHHLTTLAFSEVGSRSHFWAPIGTAVASGEQVRLTGQKSWITAAGEADSYVWSSRSLTKEGAMTLWLVPSDAEGLSKPGRFDGLGLRGNKSAPITGDDVELPIGAMLGEDGGGLEIALRHVLPWFLVLSAAFSIGLMEAVTNDTGKHLRSVRLEHLDQSLVDQPLVRVDHARMRIAADQANALLGDALAAIGAAREDALLRVLEVKAAAGEAAIAVTDLAMKVCGGAAFRKELGIERRFRDARAVRVMAPTTDALLDMIGRHINGLELL